MKPPSPEREVALARLVIQRLERLSADSIFAHQASGYRGALIKCADDVERAGDDKNAILPRLRYLTREGFNLLEESARELSDLHPALEELRRMMEEKA